jgi:ABC-type dipeptide/oligopeptide/nickel transport system permease subunit
VPGAALFITVIAFNLFGDGLRDALDPRSNR